MINVSLFDTKIRDVKKGFHARLNSHQISLQFDHFNYFSEKREEKLQLKRTCNFYFAILGTNTVNKAELELMTTLFPNSASFMKDVLPVKSKNDSVNVHLQIALRQIMDIVSTLTIHFNVATTKEPIESHLNVSFMCNIFSTRRLK